MKTGGDKEIPFDIIKRAFSNTGQTGEQGIKMTVSGKEGALHRSFKKPPENIQHAFPTTTLRRYLLGSIPF